MVSGMLAILLAAGAGTRYSASAHKLRARLAGRTVLEWSLTRVREAAVGHVVVVGGAVDLRDLVGPDGPDVTLVVNPRWADGLATSLQAGLDVARRGAHDAVVVGLADQPAVPAAAWRAVAAAAAPIAVATYGGRRANPVRLHAETWPLLPVTGDEGARSLLRVRSELVLEVPCPGSARDLDRPEDVAALEADLAAPGSP
jgi:CTP:molybdopterin cytidylyltransferase MocA